VQVTITAHCWQTSHRRIARPTRRQNLDCHSGLPIEPLSLGTEINLPDGALINSSLRLTVTQGCFRKSLFYASEMENSGCLENGGLVRPVGEALRPLSSAVRPR
jgi:hypothetical protein